MGGVTEIAANCAGVTVSVVPPDTGPLAAEIVVVPMPLDVARPVLLMVAVVCKDEVQLTELVMLSVLPLE